MKSHLFLSLTLFASIALSESELILRDCANQIRRTVSNPEDNFTVTLKLVEPKEEQLTAKSKNGETITAQISDDSATFTELTAGDWSFCSEAIQSIAYTTNSNDNLLLAGVTGAGALAGVVSFSGSSGGNSIDSTENLSLEGGSSSGDTSSQTPSTAGSTSGDSSADFARECLNEEEIDVMSRMN